MKAKNYPKPQFKKDLNHLFMFEVFLKNGEKFNTDYYTKDDARKMNSLLKAEGATFQIWEANMNDNYLTEATL